MIGVSWVATLRPAAMLGSRWQQQSVHKAVTVTRPQRGAVSG